MRGEFRLCDCCNLKREYERGYEADRDEWRTISMAGMTIDLCTPCFEDAKHRLLNKPPKEGPYR